LRSQTGNVEDAPAGVSSTPCQSIATRVPCGATTGARGIARVQGGGTGGGNGGGVGNLGAGALGNLGWRGLARGTGGSGAGGSGASASGGVGRRGAGAFGGGGRYGAGALARRHASSVAGRTRRSPPGGAGSSAPAVPRTRLAMGALCSAFARGAGPRLLEGAECAAPAEGAGAKGDEATGADGAAADLASAFAFAFAFASSDGLKTTRGGGVKPRAASETEGVSCSPASTARWAAACRRRSRSPPRRRGAVPVSAGDAVVATGLH